MSDLPSLPPSSPSTFESARDIKAERGLFLEAIDSLAYAKEDLYTAAREMRVKRLYQMLFRPIALFFALFCVSVVTALLAWAGMVVSTAFSLSLGLYVLPLLYWVWRKEGGEETASFLRNIHRADKAVMDLGWRTLLAWPTTHPEEMIEAGASVDSLLQATHLRQVQLEEELRRLGRMDEAAGESAKPSA